jgi:hypothetical protein
MATTRAAKPVTKPAGAPRVSAKTSSSKKSSAKKIAKKPSAKKATPKRVVKKSAKPKSLSALKREAAAKREAAVEKRKQTRAATSKVVGPEPIAVDPADDMARAAIAKRQVRGKRSATERADDPPPATGIALVERVTRAVERELSQIEVIVGGHHVNAQRRTEAERRARTLASLARTLTEVRKLRADEHRVKPQDDPDRPRDLEELRRRLSERLERMRRGRTDPAAEGNETGGDGLPH